MSWRLYAAFRSAFRIVSLSFQVAPFIKLLWVLNDKAISRFVSILNEDLVWFPVWKEEQNYHKGETSQEVKLPCSSKRHLIRSKSYNNGILLTQLRCMAEMLIFCLSGPGNQYTRIRDVFYVTSTLSPSLVTWLCSKTIVLGKIRREGPFILSTTSEIFSFFPQVRLLSSIPSR